MDNDIEISKVLSCDNKKSNKRRQLLNKLLDRKYWGIYLLIGVLLIVLILYVNIGEEKNEQVSLKTSTYLTTLEYSREIESKLQNILSKIEGAGEVTVMVSLDGSPEIVYATDNDSKTSSSSTGTTTTTSTNLIIVNGNKENGALILKENLPQVKGVIVVSSGADNIAIKLDMLNAVSSLLDLSTDKINILKGN